MFSSKNLSEIYKKYDIFNDVEFPSDKNSYHSYISDVYEEKLVPFKELDITLVEIGVAHSGSIRMWGEYFKNGKIYGIDNFSCGDSFRKKSLDLINNEVKNITIIEMDAYDELSLSRVPLADIIIDDGPHTLESQLFFIKHYLTKVKEGGVVVIEDIVVDFAYSIENHPSIIALLSSVPKDFSYELYDLRKNVIGRPGVPVEGRGDNVILWLQKK